MAFCSGIRKKLKTFLGKVSEKVFDYADISLKVTSSIQKLINSPVADVLTAIIPGELDNVIKAQISNALSFAISDLNILIKCSEKATLNERWACVITELGKMHPNVQDSFLMKLAALITKHMDSHEQKQNVYDSIAQLQYSLNK
jgi:hypothetical protein